MDLLYDNVSLSEKNWLLNAGKNKNNLLNIESNDLSFNNTEISSRRIISKNSQLPTPFNLYGFNNIDDDGVVKINLNNYNNNPNFSSNSSQITSLIKIPKNK